jgi:AP-3 complex subunit sigma
MIQAVLIFNNHGMFATWSTNVYPSTASLTSYLIGKPRLSKFYTPVTSAEQSALLGQIFQLVSDRPAGLCNFLDAPGLVFPGGKGRRTAKGKGKANTLRRVEGDEEEEDNEDDELRVIYRHYATLYFV